MTPLDPLSVATPPPPNLPSARSPIRIVLVPSQLRGAADALPTMPRTAIAVMNKRFNLRTAFFLRLLAPIDESTPCGRASVESALSIIRKFHASSEAKREFF